MVPCWTRRAVCAWGHKPSCSGFAFTNSPSLRIPLGWVRIPVPCSRPSFHCPSYLTPRVRGNSLFLGAKSIHLSLIPSMFFRISLLEPDPVIFFPFTETDFTIVDFLHHLTSSQFFYDSPSASNWWCPNNCLPFTRILGWQGILPRFREAGSAQIVRWGNFHLPEPESQIPGINQIPILQNNWSLHILHLSLSMTKSTLNLSLVMIVNGFFGFSGFLHWFSNGRGFPF